MAKQWIISAPPAGRAATADPWQVPPIVAQLLVNRGICTPEAHRAFLTPDLRDLHAPILLPGALEAAELMTGAVRAGKRIVLYGDYDVDGTTGVAILWHTLRLAGADVSFYVPHRVEEGYGLNSGAVGQLLKDGAEVIVSIDCGITAHDVVDEVREAGATIIITDHHAPRETTPQADAIVHPAVGGSYPNKGLCGAGVAFKLAWAIAQKISGSDRVTPEFRALLMELLPLAALGTIADVVPLVGENRIIVAHGLRRLPDTSLSGLRALIDSAGLGGDRIGGYDVGFKLAPRINAAGRMGHARLAVELLTRADEHRAREIALYLEEHNRARRSKERQIAKQAYEVIERKGLAGDSRRAIVVAMEGWHVGVIGIVASRIVDRYHRPTVVIALSNGEGQGSARSIASFALNEALARCESHLISYGGHAMAAGLRIASDAVDEFSAAFVEVANRQLTGSDLKPRLRLDTEASLDELTLPTVEMVLGLGPFGVGNPNPKLATGWVDLAGEPRCVGRGLEHLQAAFCQNGVQIKGIGFGLAGWIEDLKEHRTCRVAFEPIINEFNGRRTVEMRILDLQFPGDRHRDRTPA